MVVPVPGAFVYLASSFEHHLLRVGQVFTGAFTVCLTGLRTQINFTDFNRKLHAYGIQSFFCVFRALRLALPPSLLPAILWFRACALSYLFS